MDFMKVLDQTVRDIKREVNLKVLKVPEIEQKVLDATSSEPWGPHGSALSELAQATNKIADCRIIMNALWSRLSDMGSNWRHVYKALAVLEYLVANGSQRAVDDIVEHIYRISPLSSFEFVEPNGKDVGINVRKKVETMLTLLNDKEKIQTVRDKAATNRDKYFGLSSTGISYKSSSTSYGSTGDRYGGLGSSREDSSFKDSYKDQGNYGEETNSSHDKNDGRNKSRESLADENDLNKTKKGVTSNVRIHNRPQVSKPSSTSRPLTMGAPVPFKSSNTQSSNDDDDDDFDPRGSSTTGSTNTNHNQVDLFGESLIGDLMDAPAPIPEETTSLNTTATHEVDLFADVAFESTPPLAEATEDSHTQGNIDLFASQHTFPAAVTSNIDLMDGSDFSSSPEIKKPNIQAENNTIFDPFATIPLNNFDGPDGFGDFTSHATPVAAEPSRNSVNSSDLNQTSQSSSNNNVSGANPTSMMASKPTPKKDTFQVKSGIWADSLSRGLIDLNITAPKKVSLTDIGIVGGLDDGSSEKEKGPPTYMGRAMGAGSSLNWSGFTSSTGGNSNFSTPGQQQFGTFK